LLVHRAGSWLEEARQRRALRPFAAIAAPLQRFAASCVRLAFDIDLDASAKIGPGLVIYHFGGIRLRNCRIGSDCEIAQEVRIEPRPGEMAGPTVGDRVHVHPHGRIVGAVSVGEDAKIGAGTVVTEDVPPGVFALGAPARVSRVGRTN
jgi:serine acetyltransferase